MKQIDEWEILTPNGWKDFSGIVELEKEVITVKFDNNEELTGSKTHRVMSNTMKELQELKIGDIVETEQGHTLVIEISETKEKQKVYDLVEVESEGHQYYTNNIISHNCDEMAFIPNRIQDEFMAGTAPSLSATRGKMIVTSTPNGSRDLFAKIWQNSGMEWDKKEMTYLRTNKAKNEFEPLFIPYWIDETKNTPEWIEREKRTLDDPVKFKVEFECLDEETMVDVFDTVTEEYKSVSLKEINETLNKDIVTKNLIV